jgi:hypothetical protein
MTEQRINRVFEALADHLERLSDDELLAEVRDNGESPEVIAATTRALIQDTVNQVKQREASGFAIRFVQQWDTAADQIPTAQDVAALRAARMKARRG